MPRVRSEKSRSEESWTRSTSACNGCRQRKQKCGGEKPLCLRCRTLNQTCVWPKQQKRGPAKGYIEALETRLQETESVLLGALSVIPDADLALTLMGNSEAQNGTEEGENRVAKPSRSGELLKATAERRRSILEFWKEYPLHSRDDILRWREASLSSRGNQLGLRAGLPERTQSYSVERNEDELSGTVENDNSNGDTHETIQEVFQPARPIYHGTRANEEFDQGQEHHPQFHEVQVADTHIQNTELEPQRSTSVTGFGLSKEFRDKFLW